MKGQVTIVHAYDTEVELHLEPSPYAPSGTIYFVSPQEDFLKYARTLYDAEKDRSEWIRKYQNVLNGLNYWKSKAMEL